MSQISTQPPSGFRDFLPEAVRHREEVFAVIEEVYRAHGFEPLDTPACERLDTLLGKYGEEGDKLIFKLMKRGRKLTDALSEHEDPGESDLADMGLRYDLTVPLARVYAEYGHDFPRHLKRYQIGPVWRADRPQKGRYREFYQCDVDVIGSDTMTVEAEVCSAASEVLERLGFTDFRIHTNHRELLRGLMAYAQVPDHLEGDALVALDKFDKIGRDGVVEELEERGIGRDSIDRLMPLLTREGDAEGVTLGVEDNEATLARLEEAIGDDERGRRGLDDLRALLDFASVGPAGDHIVLDPMLARGLSYYTGPIFEVRSDDFAGSIAAGGRYDDLIGMFTGRESVPACGFSLGVERIILLMEERGLFDTTRAGVDVLVTLWNEEFTPNSLRLARELRDGGLRVDVYAEHHRYGKQFKYADRRDIPFVAILAPDELEADVVALKDMASGDQEEVPRGEAANWLLERLDR